MAGSSTGQGEFLLYQTEDAQTWVQVRFQDGGIWLTQAQLAELYQCSSQNITQHVRAIYESGELPEEATCKPYLQVRLERGRQVSRSLKHYSLEVVLAVGYRAKSHRGTQLRRWATEQLKTYLTKGVLLDDERFKRGDDTEYFEELLARIRDIRSSEKVFWRKVLDIYATSMDYDPHTETSQQFFATVQNKMHWAAHGHTAAELIALRADAAQPNMGLTSWTAASRGGPVRKADVSIAKNYLNAEELDTLNRIVTAYIEVAELQAQARQPMTMRDWAAELDNFLRLTRKDILTHAGKVSAEAALAKAQAAYAEYQAHIRVQPSPVEKDFEATIAQPVRRLEKGRKALPNKKKVEQT
ncbi:MAG: hydroxyacid dehydrogenase [Betaproteobacteria bacterium HGW-Betaproteobacteria-13]|nr:MAG: hydroxyacid dehydrogenase [Gammaproteobacteria bacterium HGW-Gammaproteobacteria-4]PKO79466.1 MAG: hydroxyacid dehydrogenase [Betaproteobacteria bacterium HGW-Betaproteobacteria-13]PKO85392.1 MAG: hydroxyacid dehydrogenase [Betaproteobacteria bacterium HGW-Betaproteobacteria-12]